MVNKLLEVGAAATEEADRGLTFSKTLDGGTKDDVPYCFGMKAV